MSIVLKTDPKELASDLDFYLQDSEHGQTAYSALAAHAMQMAIEEAKHYDDPNKDFTSTEELADWINERAAANLARLMGEGNGNGS